MKDATLNQASKILSLFAETPNEQIQAILGSGLLADLRDGNIDKINRDEYRKLCGLKSFNPEMPQKHLQAAIEGRFDADFFRETGELTLNIPALSRPSLSELQEKFSWIRSIKRNISPTEAVTLRLGTVLRSDKERIIGTEYERRIAPKLNITLGYQQAVWLVEHQDEFPAFLALLGKIYIDFPGLVVVSADGRRCFPCFGKDGKRWCLGWYWIDSDLRRYGRIAVSGK